MSKHAEVHTCLGVENDGAGGDACQPGPHVCLDFRGQPFRMGGCAEMKMGREGNEVNGLIKECFFSPPAVYFDTL